MVVAPPRGMVSALRVGEMTFGRVLPNAWACDVPVRDVVARAA